MAWTNQTKHGLPQYVASDKPAWLTDWNSAMEKIDTLLDDTPGGALENVESDILTLQGQVEAINTKNSSQDTEIENVKNSVESIENADVVDTFNGRSGAVTPAAGDYTDELVTTANINLKTLFNLSQTAEYELPVGDFTEELTDALVNANVLPTINLWSYSDGQYAGETLQVYNKVVNIKLSSNTALSLDNVNFTNCTIKVFVSDDTEDCHISLGQLIGCYVLLSNANTVITQNSCCYIVSNLQPLTIQDSYGSVIVHYGSGTISGKSTNDIIHTASNLIAGLQQNNTAIV